MLSRCDESRFTDRATAFKIDYMQPLILNDAMRVLQLNEPSAFRYSVVYQKVQSSTGSTLMWL